MNQILWLVTLSSIWFVVLLIIKNLAKIKFCVACVTISSTWLALLFLKSIGISIDPLIIAILMGQSIVGVYYLLDKKLPEIWLVFRWPYLISSTVLVYLIIGSADQIGKIAVLIVGLWLIFAFIFLFRRFPGLKIMADKLVACCRDW
jgi:hypothetical protein